MTIVNLGISHRTAPPEVLEKLAVPSAQRGTVLARLRAVPAIDEVAVLSTCNRVEVYVASRDPAGLVAARTAGPAITGLIDAALRASKRARAQTSISTEGISLTRAGLTLARACLGDLTTCQAVVVGTGSTGRLAAKVAGARGTPLRTRDVPEALADADILVTATGAAVPVVLASHVRAARALAGRPPLFVLDLGMPPDVEPAVGRLDGVTLVDIAALGRHLADRARPGQIPQVGAIVAAETEAYLERQDQAAAAPVIAAMHAHIRQLADAELARLRHKLSDLSEEQQAELAATVHRILRKVLHQPTVRAKELSAGPKGPICLDALRQLFDLNTAEAGT